MTLGDSSETVSLESIYTSMIEAFNTQMEPNFCGELESRLDFKESAPNNIAFNSHMKLDKSAKSLTLTPDPEFGAGTYEDTASIKFFYKEIGEEA